MHKITPLAAIVAVAGLSAAASAQLINPVSQTRTVEFGAAASDFAPNPELFDSDAGDVAAADFGLFDENIGGSATTNAASGNGYASQISSISGAVIDAEGYAGGGGQGGFGGSGDGWGSSYFSVTFELTQVVDYTLAWSIGGFGMGSNGFADILLTGPGGDVHSAFADNSDDTQTVMGTLNPGVYTLSANAGGGGFGDEFTFDSYSDGSFDVTMTVTPTPGAAAGLLLAGGFAATRRRR